MKTAERKADLALFADNVALCHITESLVFTDPYFAAPMNRHTSPELDGLVAQLRADVDLKVAAQQMKLKYCNHAETLVHGDLHTGSIMAHAGEARVIDPEFASYGPFGFDIGMLIANFLMAFFAQAGYERQVGERDDFRDWTLDVADNVWTTLPRRVRAALARASARAFCFRARSTRTRATASPPSRRSPACCRISGSTRWGSPASRCTGASSASRISRSSSTSKMPTRRAACEAKALRLGRHLAVNRARLLGFADVRAAALRLEMEGIG